MNKEEQQQILYKNLLQRNQNNYDIIRKYRKKSCHYHKYINKAISQANNIHNIPNLQNNQSVPNTVQYCQHNLNDICNFVQQGYVDIDGGDKQIQENTQLAILHNHPEYYKQQISRMNIQTHQHTQANDNNLVKLPTLNRNQTTQKICQTNNNNIHNNTIKIQIISLKTVNQSQTLPNNIPIYKQNRHKLFAVTESHEPIQHIKQQQQQQQNSMQKQRQQQILTSLSKNIKKYNYIKYSTNITQSVRNTVLEKNSMLTHSIKRQFQVSNSHKTLLNLQQIVFEGHNTHLQNKKNNYSNGNNINILNYKTNKYSKQEIPLQNKQKIPKTQDIKINKIDKDKYKKMNKYQKIKIKETKQNNIDVFYSCNGLPIKSYQKNIAIQNFKDLTNFIVNSCIKDNQADCVIGNNNQLGNHNNTQSDTQLQLNPIKHNNQSSISLSALSSINPNIIHSNQTKIKMSTSTSTSCHPVGSQCPSTSHMIQNINIKQTPNVKTAQYLPKIRKHKQKEYQLNFQKYLKKDQNRQPIHTGNNNANNNVYYGQNRSKHNYSFSLNNIQQDEIRYKQKYQKFLKNKNQSIQKDKKIFKIQAIPIQKIKWM